VQLADLAIEVEAQVSGMVKVGALCLWRSKWWKGRVACAGLYLSRRKKYLQHDSMHTAASAVLDRELAGGCREALLIP
jgi:hypothetical protein